MAIAAVTALALALAPLGSRSTVDTSGVVVDSRVSLLAAEGPRVLAILAVPVLVVALPVLLGDRYSARARIVAVTRPASGRAPRPDAQRSAAVSFRSDATATPREIGAGQAVASIRGRLRLT